MSTTPPQDYEALRTEITERYDTLSKRLRQIAKFTWDNPTVMAMETTSVIAERAGVQPSALIRFAKAFGYSGFSEMQRLFQARVTERSASYKERFKTVSADSDDATKGGPSKMLVAFCEANKDALSHLQESAPSLELNKAVDLLRKAQQVFIMGQRRSYPVASYISYSLNHLDCRAHLLHGIGGMLAEQSQTLSKNDVLIAISFAPYSEETAQVVATARDKGVPIIVITDSLLSPIAGQATVCFEVHDAEVYSFRSLTASMCLAQALTTSLAIDMTQPRSDSRKKKRT
jgi:DNA-binding MurR/RpiR family transcriptional regulator